MSNNYKVVWLSAGVSSFIGGYLVKDTVDEWIYIDVKDQHPDSMRFIHDCEKAIGKKVTILRSEKYEDVEDVCRKLKFGNSPHGAACTGMLKKQVRKQWESRFYAEHGNMNLTYVWGFDRKERKRAENMIANFPEFDHEFPLIDKCISKEDAHGLLMSLGIKRPAMYDLGFPNNNCIGCLKQGAYFWNKTRKLYPEVFEKRAKLERDLGHSFMNGVFLDELDPNAGRANEIVPECSIFCYQVQSELKENESETIFTKAS